MKLKNKKTGEIVEPFGITCVNGRTFVQFDDGEGTFKFEVHSLAELNAEWEDYEEQKEYWYIDPEGTIICEPDDEAPYDNYRKQIGNYFDTREEAEKAPIASHDQCHGRLLYYGTQGRAFCSRQHEDLPRKENR